MDDNNLDDSGDDEKLLSIKGTACNLCGKCCGGFENQENTLSESGSETSLVLDTLSEGIKQEEKMGVELKFQMTPEEIYECIMMRNKNRKNKTIQIRNTLIHVILIVLLVFAGVATGTPVYSALSIIPLITIILIWLAPVIMNMRLSNRIYEKGQMCVDIFKDNIHIRAKDFYREIKLNGTSVYEEVGDVMIISPPKGEELIIPTKVIDAEYLPEVQAMISAGTRPFTG